MKIEKSKPFQFLVGIFIVYGVIFIAKALYIYIWPLV